MKAIVFGYMKGKHVTLGELRLRGDEIVFAVNPECGNVTKAKSLLVEMVEESRNAPSPEAYLKATPSMYSGAYFRVKFVGGDVKKAGTWNEAEHPRQAGGAPAGVGGQFASAGGGAGAPKPEEKDPTPGGEPSPTKPGNEHPMAAVNDWNDTPREHQVAAREDFGRAWAHDNKDGAALQNVEPDQLEQMGRVAFDRKNDLKKLDWAKGMDADKFPAKPLAPGLPTDQLGKEPRAGMPGGGTTPDQNEEAQRIQDFRAGRGEAPAPEVLQRWRDRGWVADDAVFEKQPTPEPEQEEYTQSNDEQEEEDATFVPEDWDQMSEDQQNEAKQKWMDQKRSDYVRSLQRMWAEEDQNFENVPENLEEDETWNNDAIKESAEEIFGVGTKPGVPRNEDDNDFEFGPEERQQWRHGFDLEESLAQNAFTWDQDGKLTVDEKNLVFTDNPYNEDTGQQMLPGISREDMKESYNRAQWAKVDKEFRQAYKAKWEKELEKRIDHERENPPDWVGDDADEFMEQHWDGLKDREKFDHAKDLLSELGAASGRQRHVGGGGRNRAMGGGFFDGGGRGRGDGIEGQIEPSPDDSPAQKELLSKTPKSYTPNNGGISQTDWMTMNDGSEWVWKPSNGEVAAHNLMPAGEQYIREVAAHDLGQIVGMGHMFPLTAIIRGKGKGGVDTLGAVLSKIPNSKNNAFSGNESFAEDGQRSVLFDYMIGNVDRHQNNWMHDTAGKLWLVDHGRTFPKKPRSEFYNELSPKVIADRSEAIPETVIGPWRNKWDKIEALLRRRGLDDSAVSSMKTRYDNVMGKEGATWRDLS